MSAAAVILLALACTLGTVTAGCASAAAPASVPRADRPDRAATTGANSARAASRQTPKDAILRDIPASTPYFFGSLKPVPADSFRREFGALGLASENGIAELLGSVAPDVLGAQLLARLLHALRAELSGLITPDEVAKIGIEPELRFAIYAIGLHPALRLALSDDARFWAFFERALARAKIRAAQREFRRGDRRVAYWNLTLRDNRDDSSLVVAIIAGQLVAGMIPNSGRATMLPALLGVEPPSAGMADSRLLTGILSEYKFAPWSVGFISLARTANILVGKGNAVARASARALGVRDVPRPCQMEVPGLASALPRIALGLYQSSDERTSGALIFETRADISQALNALQTAIPGSSLSEEEQVKLAIGVGMELQGALDYLIAKLRAVNDMPYTCPWLARLNSWATNSSFLLAAMIPAITGVNAVFDEIDVNTLNLQGVLLIDSDEPEKLWNVLALGFPGLGTLNVEPNRLPVPVPGGLVPLWSPAYVAMSPDGLGVAIGPAAQDYLKRGLSSDVSNTSPVLLTLRVDRGWWEAIDREQDAVPTTKKADKSEPTREPINHLRPGGYGDALMIGAMTSRGLVVEFIQHYRKWRQD